MIDSAREGEIYVGDELRINETGQRNFRVSIVQSMGGE
jgi:hypothetical protein